MEQKIEHSYIKANGLTHHIAEAGKNGTKGTVLFIHGFPEIWYTWRHQMIAAANSGYHTIAPDSRGYGLSDQPDQIQNAKWEDFTDDIIAILDHFKVAKAFIVGKDSGAIIAYDFAVYHPDRLAGILTMGIPFAPHGFALDLLPEGFYIWRWREEGRPERDFSRFEVKTVIRNIYILFSSSELPIASKDEEIMDLVNESTPLPSWFTEEDLEEYAKLYEKSGFEFPMQMPYRSLCERKEMVEPKIEVPAMLIMGEKDYCFKFPGIDEVVRSGNVKKYVTKLEVVFVEEGSHFVQEQFPERVNELVIGFFDAHV